MQDRVAELDYDSALVLLRAARDADPANFLAHAWYIEYTQLYGAGEDVRREYAAFGQSRNALLACFALVTRTPDAGERIALSELQALERRLGETECSAWYKASWAYSLQDAVPTDEVLGRLSRAARYQPQHVRTRVLVRGKRPLDATHVLEDAIRRFRHPLERNYLYLVLAGLRLDQGDTSRAVAISRAVSAAVQRDGRPGLKLNYLLTLVSRADLYVLASGKGAFTSPRDAKIQLIQQIARFAGEHGVWPIELVYLQSLGNHYIARGQPATALALFDRCVAIADSVEAASYQLLAYTWRGRAYSKLGKLTEAERDLLRAVNLGLRAHDPFNLAEAYHNLAHTYEGMGRMELAARAADRFIETAGSTSQDDMRTMSYRDAGMIHWKAGWHATAHSLFKQMVRLVDEQKDSHHWAGEYLERTGQLHRALEYYRQGLQNPDGADVVASAVNVGGLARVYEAIGMLDSAEAAARLHDRIVHHWLPPDQPLLPALLVRRGRMEEALRLSRDWTTRQLEAGNIHGAAIAQLGLAELLRQANRASEALQVAQRAESLAIRLTLTDELIEAQRAQGLSLLELRQPAAALRSLRSAVATAERHPTAPALLKTHMALAEALSTLGRAEEALAEYDRAARVVETMTTLFDEDLDRARFRERHLAPFDGALRVLLAGHAEEDVEPLIRWSQRRKGAALALATQERGGGDAPPRRLLSLGQLQRGLARDEALIDYLVLGSVVAAIAVTPREALLQRLPISPDSLHRLIEQLRKPLVTTYVGRVDLARAPFDLRIAFRLGETLIRPVLGSLSGVRHLMFVPDAALHYVPFGALVIDPPPGPTGSPAGYVPPTYLVDRYEISYLPSAQFLAEPRGDAIVVKPTDQVLMVVNGAPGGTEEAERVARVWPNGGVVVLHDTAATETAVRNSWSGYPVLHFASHAVADDRDPLGSHLALTGDGEHDGYLHLNEIAAQRLSARLVVLSACETLSGRLYHGEGLMSLARGFLAAGARTILATQWPIGPATAELMEHFYRELVRGADPSTALRTAQLALRFRKETAHPFFWGGFVLIRGTSGVPRVATGSAN